MLPLLLACTSLSGNPNDPSASGSSDDVDDPVHDEDTGEVVTNKDGDDALVEYVSLQPELACSAADFMTIVVTNTGTTSWSEEDEIRLGAVDDQDPLAVDTRLYLPDGVEVRPGDTWVFNIDAVAPPTPGTYTTDWRMVREDVHWFGDIGSEEVDVSCDGGGVDTGEEDPGTTVFDLDDVIWLHTDVSGWPEAAKLSSVSVSLGSDQICLDHDKTDVWDSVDIGDGTLVNANPWVFAEVDGQWYAATWEWMRPSQTCKSASSVAGDHIKKSPFDDMDWTPSSGETLYFMVSGLARFSERNHEERTNLVEVTWP